MELKNWHTYRGIAIFYHDNHWSWGKVIMYRRLLCFVGLELQAEAVSVHIAGTSGLHQDHLLSQGEDILGGHSRVLNMVFVFIRSIPGSSAVLTIRPSVSGTGNHAHVSGKG